ncbi:MFS transporter [Hasllibacter sp. MH4015]|uniref:MFS transporter n=1 Tax=Hasllibacter sp. MH4015 TaxID=2854029 RepID=UPI001CD2CB7C|nr:MFS transporter [Hasllibacter sp. MH4015]
MIVPARPAPIVAALGIVQILTWGSSFYLVAVLSSPIALETGWSLRAISGGVSLALLIAGLCAPRVGHLIRSHGGRPVLLGGIGLLMIGQILLASATNLPLYFLAWVVLGAGMAGALYNAAFSALGVIYGAGARGAITRLTLWGGFASTICWPLTAFFVEHLGWRGAVLCYVGINLFVTVPLVWFVLPRHTIDAAPDTATELPPVISAFDPRFACMAVAGISLSLVGATVSVHLITLLTATGISVAAAVGLGALIGPAQVGARLLELLGRERHHPVVTLIAAAAFICAGFAILRFNLPAAAGLIAYGAGNGLFSIARGTVPLAVFGVRDYAPIMGRLARPILLASAAGPFLGAFVIEALGPQTTLTLLLILTALPLLSALVLAALIRRG